MFLKIKTVTSNLFGLSSTAPTRLQSDISHPEDAKVNDFHAKSEILLVTSSKSDNNVTNDSYTRSPRPQVLYKHCSIAEQGRMVD